MRKKKNGKNYLVGNERKEAILGRLVFWGTAGEEKPADVKNVAAAKHADAKNGAAKLVEKNGKELVKNTDNYLKNPSPSKECKSVVFFLSIFIAVLGAAGAGAAAAAGSGSDAAKLKRDFEGR